MPRIQNMPFFALALGALLFALGCGGSSSAQVTAPLDTEGLKSGDIIFQESRSAQSAAIQAATDSRYSHMGIIYVDNGQPLVYEAVQPVRLTPLSEWVRRGEDGHAVVKRLKNAARLLTPEVLKAMRAEGEKHRGKNYDLTFTWDDERMYCSELVYKIFQRGGGIEIGALQKLEDFDLIHPAVQEKLKERYGDKLPLKETVISPKAMFDAKNLETVKTYK